MNRYLYISVFCILFLLTANAQQPRFVYMEAEDKSSFSVIVNKRTYSSGKSGSIIIPQLVEGKNELTVKSQKISGKELKFICNLITKGTAYILKNTEGRTILFNPQTKTVINPQGSSTVRTETIEITTDAVGQPHNAFGAMLADVVDDASILVKKGIVKASHKEIASGTELIFIDARDDGADTIKVFVPKRTSSNANKTVVIKDKDTIATIVRPAGSVAVKNKGAGAVGSDNYVNFNSKCISIANTKDFKKTRDKILQEKEDTNKMLDEVTKRFSAKCYTTQQITSLAQEFFVTDELRYKFLRVAYPAVADIANFSSLENFFTDGEYKKRFRELMK